jgi:hypothetical protein
MTKEAVIGEIKRLQENLEALNGREQAMETQLAETRKSMIFVSGAIEGHKKWLKEFEAEETPEAEEKELEKV